MKNIIISVPVDTELTEEQQATINSIKGQWVTMPGTRVYDNRYIVDALVKDSFTASMLPEGWTLLYSGSGTINSDFINYLADKVTYDDEGNELTRERPIEMYEPHRFAGHPARIKVEVLT